MPDIYFEALKKWGHESQIKMMIEECAELIAVLHHYDRGKVRAIEVCGEIADVDIMVQQMKALFGPKCEDIKKHKLGKLKELLKQESL